MIRKLVFVMVVRDQMMKKKIWKNPDTSENWKKENLNSLKKRMSKSQLSIFEKSYNEKLEFGKLVYSKT